MPNLEEIMGADFRADMTAEDINSYFTKKVLESGKYELKDKVDAERKSLKKQLADKDVEIQSKMSADELANAEKKALEKRIKELEEANRNSALERSSLKAEGILAESKVLMGIKADDTEYSDFVKSISNEDFDKTEKLSSYINKMIKEAYEKGKTEATKNGLGNMGKQKQGSSNESITKDQALVERLTANAQPKAENARSNFF